MSQILPTGENNFYDKNQTNLNNSENVSPIEKDSIFEYNNLISNFSNAPVHLPVDRLQIFNPYVHYYSDFNSNLIVEIPYLSSYKISTIYDPYPQKVKEIKDAQ